MYLFKAILGAAARMLRLVSSFRSFLLRQTLVARSRLQYSQQKYRQLLGPAQKRTRKMLKYPLLNNFQPFKNKCWNKIFRSVHAQEY